MANKTRVEKGDIITGEVIDLSSQGRGVIKVGSYPIFVSGLVPGDGARVQVTKAGQSYGQARLLEVTHPSKDRVPPREEGPLMGTIPLQTLAYPAQLDFKTKQVKDALERIGHFKGIQVPQALGMEDPWTYRNKAQVPVREVDGLLSTGFYKPGTHDLVPIEDFHIQAKEIDQALVLVRDILRDHQVPAYNEKTNRGTLRHIVVRRGHDTGQVMVILVTNGPGLKNKPQVIEDIASQVPGLVSLIQNIQEGRTNVIMGKKTRTLWGQDYLMDSMLGLDFKISPASFYQVNTPQAERLYKEAIRMAQVGPEDIVLDAYCGIGTLSLALAQEAKKVYAMDIVKEAIDMAKENARLNGLENTHFEAGPAEKVLPAWKNKGLSFDLALVDPPRKGLDPGFIKTLTDLAPRKIVYISCKPSTQARDLALFREGGYELEEVLPVDLFPQTSHVETICLMSRVKD